MSGETSLSIVGAACTYGDELLCEKGPDRDVEEVGCDVKVVGEVA